MRATPLSNERGIALAVAVFALVVIGALVAGVFFAGRLEQQTGQNTIYATQASEVAEAGLADALALQKAPAMLALQKAPAANPTAVTTTSFGAHVSSVSTITRLTDNVFLIKSIGTMTDGAGTVMAQRSLGQLIRLVQVQLSVKAGLTAMGDVTISGGADVTGKDAVPSAWASGVECPPLADQAGVRYNGGTLQQKGNGAFSGAPDSVKDASLNTDDMKKNFDKLKALATLTVTDGNPAATGPAYTNGNPKRCDTSVQTNWGEPAVTTDPCFTYFPIIYHYGNLSLQGGRGQGILLVEGDLSATGGMVFYGPVYVTGTLSTTGNSNQGAKFYGGVVAGNVALDDQTKLSGGALVSYSSCAVKRALQNSSTPTPLTERSWVQLY